MSKSVWLLVGIWEIEGYDPIKVFRSEEKARNLCKFILGPQPLVPVSEDEVKILRRLEKCYCDDFAVLEIPIDDEE